MTSGRGVSAPSGDLTISQHLNSWLESRRDGQHIRNSTYELESFIRCHIIPVIGSVKVMAITPALVQQLLDRKAKEGLSRRSSNIFERSFAQVLASVIGRGSLSRTPLCRENAKRAPSQADIGSEEVKRVLRVLDKLRLYPLVLTAVYTGLRQGELLGPFVVRHRLRKGAPYRPPSIPTGATSGAEDGPQCQDSSSSFCACALIAASRPDCPSTYHSLGLLFPDGGPLGWAQSIH